MRAWLQKPWVVGLLVLVAAATLWLRFAPLLRPASASLPPVPSLPAIADSTTKSATPSSRKHGLDWARIARAARQTRWRDPFFARAKATRKSAFRALSHRHKPRLPRLGAIMRGPDGAYAWLDGHPVRVGGRIHGMVLVGIDDAGVILRKGGRMWRIRLPMARHRP